MPFRDLPGAVPCRFHRGERIIKEGTPITHLYYLTKGTVYREIVTDRGNESIMSSRGGGTSVMQSLVGILATYNLDNGNMFNSDFFAYTDCIAYRIPVEEAKAYLRQHPELLEESIVLAMDEYNKVVKLFQSRREGSASARLCELLLERAKETEEGLLVSHKCTNVEIGKLLSIHKVTVSRMLRALKEEGTVERSTAGLRILRPDRLKQYAENELLLEYE